jgi:GAF domain-containing protein
MENNSIQLNQIKSIINKELPLVSNLSNVTAVLNKLENINWVGFYLVEGDKLYLGPFQGDVACTIIPKGKGVCGTSFERKETIIVPDVNKFAGHIACSSLSKSEIVTPIIKDNEVKAVIDIDSPIYDRFHDDDKVFLEEIAKEISYLY